MKKQKQTLAERDAVLGRELERVQCEIARQRRTGKKRPVQWVVVDLNTGVVSPPPNALRVIK